MSEIRNGSASGGGPELPSFEDVLASELQLLNALRVDKAEPSSDPVYARAVAMNLAGLAFSGGGIRSATFNLGVIQALAKHGLLSKFDYLSTVSGGGYIGAWLSALLQRRLGGEEQGGGKVEEWDVREFEPRLKIHPQDPDIDPTAGFPAVEPLAVRYLRRYGRYLAPKAGLSGDMFANVSIVVRNFILLQLALISFLTSVLLLAHVLVLASSRVQPIPPVWLGIGALVLFMCAVFSAGVLFARRNLRRRPAAAGERDVRSNLSRPDGQKSGSESSSGKVNGLVIVPCLLSGVVLSIALALAADAPFVSSTDHAGVAARWFFGGGVVYFLPWFLGGLLGEKSFRLGDVDGGFDGVLAGFVSGGLAGLLLFVAAKYVAPVDSWHVVAYGPPLFLLGISFIVSVHMGIGKNALSEHLRESVARLGGRILALAALWALVFSLVLYAAPLVQWLAAGGTAALWTWVAGSGVGAWVAAGSGTDGVKRGLSWKEIVARVAPWFFVLGLAVLVAYTVHLVVNQFAIGEPAPVTPFLVGELNSSFAAAAGNALSQLHALEFSKTLALSGAAIAVFLVIAWRLDINLFSLHSLYCNRLVRAYLGASRARERAASHDRFNGFDENDDVVFSALAGQRPIHIINTAVNMTGVDDLAWQTRRAASFAFTPCWAGYEVRDSQGCRMGGYRRMAQYGEGKLKLGTLLAISGAAASPNMGYHTSPAVAALLTVFNLRLGRWCGNPTSGSWDKLSPLFSAFLIYRELTGSANTKAGWINLTDGGHFENLGVYELVRRRCRVIVAVDAGCDPKYEFDDLGSLLRKCWVDLGVDIRFPGGELMRATERDPRYCTAHYAVGQIKYSEKVKGTIIYIKSSLTGDERPDVRQYADAHPTFPHESTADQLFDENQFEAYRHLGYHVAEEFIPSLREALLATTS